MVITRSGGALAKSLNGAKLGPRQFYGRFRALVKGEESRSCESETLSQVDPCKKCEEIELGVRRG